jgi:hypothetical protein
MSLQMQVESQVRAKAPKPSGRGRNADLWNTGYMGNPETMTALSLATVMGPGRCHEEGTACGHE